MEQSLYDKLIVSKEIDPQGMEQNTDVILRLLYKDLKLDSKPQTQPKSLTNSLSTDSAAIEKTLSKEEIKSEDKPVKEKTPEIQQEYITDWKLTEPTHTVVIFSVKVDTLPNEDVYIVGNTESLGLWSPEKAVKLFTSREVYPMWKTSIIISTSTPFLEYKYIKKNSVTNECNWEKFTDNRTFQLNSNFEAWYSVDDGVYGKKEDQKILNSKSLNQLQHELTLRNDIIQQQNNQKLKSDKEIENLKEQLSSLEKNVNQLKKHITIYEGKKLETLASNDLKVLAKRSKHTSHKAYAVLTKRLEDEGYHMKRERDCAVCMDNVIDTVYLPCGHMAVCSNCALKLCQRCVICNAKVSKIHKVILK